MGDEFEKWSESAFEQLAAAIKDAGTQLDDEFDKIQTGNTALYEKWTGPSQEAYNDSFEEWSKKQDQIDQIIKSLEGLTHKLQESNVEAEGSAAARMA